MSEKVRKVVNSRHFWLFDPSRFQLVDVPIQASRIETQANFLQSKKQNNSTFYYQFGEPVQRSGPRYNKTLL